MGVLRYKRVGVVGFGRVVVEDVPKGPCVVFVNLFSGKCSGFEPAAVGHEVGS